MNQLELLGIHFNLRKYNLIMVVIKLFHRT